MKTVLVVMSTYNGEKYLLDQINSILNQEEVKVNLLIRDDGSKDNTVSIIRSINDERVQLCQAENVGCAHSFFYALKMASINYDYYALADQDDYWETDKLISAINMLEDADDKYKVYFSGQILTDSSLNKIYDHKLSLNRSKESFWIFNQAAGCTMVFNKELLLMINRYTPQIMFGHDGWILRLCIALGGCVKIEPEGHILYRQHGDNAVGIQTGIKGKLSRAQDYIFKYTSVIQAKGVLEGYSDYLNQEWKSFLNDIAYANVSIKARASLITNSKIKFGNIYLKLLFWIKLILKQL